MAFESWDRAFTRIAAVDLSAAQYKGVALNGSSQLTLSPLGAAGYFGVVQNAPALGQAGTCVRDGVTKMVAGAAITPGAAVTTDAAGQAIPAGVGNVRIGIALLGASAAGVVISVDLDRNGTA